MPCNSDYLEPNGIEIELSKVYQLLDELNGKKLPKSYGDGFDKRVYDKRFEKKDLDEKVRELCSSLKLEPDVTKYSLELQIWWRDHKKVDRKREKKNNNNC